MRVNLNALHPFIRWTTDALLGLNCATQSDVNWFKTNRRNSIPMQLLGIQRCCAMKASTVANGRDNDQIVEHDEKMCEKRIQNSVSRSPPIHIVSAVSHRMESDQRKPATTCRVDAKWRSLSLLIPFWCVLIFSRLLWFEGLALRKMVGIALKMTENVM